jgi:GntR family transcriptional regulator/MocR family aminotransferase
VLVLQKEPLSLERTGPLVELDLDRSRPLGLQIEERVRSLIRSELLPIGTVLPSTRALAADLGISRGVVVSAYAQLAAEAYITLRRGAPPLVAAGGHAAEPIDLGPDVPIAGLSFNLRPDLPDLALFPRAEWLRSCRRAVESAASYDFSYGDMFGSDRLRIQISQFLGRTRGTVSPFGRVGIFAGSTQALLQIGSVLREEGKERSPSRIPRTAGGRACSLRPDWRRSRSRWTSTVYGSRNWRTSTPSSSARSTSSRPAPSSHRSGGSSSSSGPPPTIGW